MKPNTAAKQQQKITTHMPHKITVSTKEDNNVKSDDVTLEGEVPFCEWAGVDTTITSSNGTEEEDNSNSIGDDKEEKKNGIDSTSDDDDDYYPTSSLETKETDVEFNINDYVDEVQMKREEDAAEDAAEKAAKTAKGKGKSSKSLQVSTTTTCPAKRKGEDRSPQVQDLTSSKKASVHKGPKTADSTAIYRKVNAKSHNRRVCNRMIDDAASTPERRNQWSHVLKTQFTFRIKIPAVEKPIEAISTILKEFVQELTRIDDSAAILPWQAMDRKSKRIIKPADVPSTLSQLRTYLKKFFMKPNKETTIYPGIYIGHNLSCADLREGLQDWLATSNHALFYMMLQAEDSSEIGWLLYTTREMDAGAMADEIADLVGIRVGLRWKVIDIGVKGKIPDAQKVNALVVEVETKYKWEAQQKLTSYFGRNWKDIKEYPNGVRVRFVKQQKDALSTVEKGKLNRLRSRQQLFLSTIQSTETWDILQLDYNCGSHDAPTLRQMIMGLTAGPDDAPLFHSVDLDWKGVGYVFQYSPSMKAQAECTIYTLLPLLQHHYPECNLEGNFTQEVVKRCQHMKFDETTGTIVDPHMEESMRFMDNDNLPGFALDLSAMTALSLDEQRPTIRTGFPSDIDSVSTLGRGATTMSSPTPRIATVSVNAPTPLGADDTSIISSTSAITVETINTIQTQLLSLQQQVTNTDSKFNEIINLLRQGNGETQQARSGGGTPTTVATLDAGGGLSPSSGNVP